MDSAYLRDAPVLGSRFIREAYASLPVLGMHVAGALDDDVFAGVRWQRVRLHQDQGVPE